METEIFIADAGDVKCSQIVSSDAHIEARTFLLAYCFNFVFTKNVTIMQLVKVKVNQSRYRPAVAQRVPGS